MRRSKKSKRLLTGLTFYRLFGCFTGHGIYKGIDTGVFEGLNIKQAPQGFKVWERDNPSEMMDIQGTPHQDNSQVFQASLNGLKAGTKYQAKAFVKYITGDEFTGNVVEFTASHRPPEGTLPPLPACCICVSTRSIDGTGRLSLPKASRWSPLSRGSQPGSRQSSCKHKKVVLVGQSYIPLTQTNSRTSPDAYDQALV